MMISQQEPDRRFAGELRWHNISLLGAAIQEDEHWRLVLFIRPAPASGEAARARPRRPTIQHRAPTCPKRAASAFPVRRDATTSVAVGGAEVRRTRTGEALASRDDIKSGSDYATPAYSFATSNTDLTVLDARPSRSVPLIELARVPSRMSDIA